MISQDRHLPILDRGVVYQNRRLFVTGYRYGFPLLNGRLQMSRGLQALTRRLFADGCISPSHTHCHHRSRLGALNVLCCLLVF